MLLRCLKAEGMKCRRSPVWLAFLVMPLFPAVLGTVNYLGNTEVLENGWYSLWSQHTLFSSMFFLPAQFGVFCAWQWRLEHTDRNWNSFMTAPVPARDLCLAKLVLAAGVSLLAQVSIAVLFLISGKVAGRERVILGRTDRGMDKPLKIDDGIYFESYFDTQYLLKVMKERVLDAVGYDYSGILLYVRDPALEKKLQQEADSLEEDMETGPEEETEGLSMGML